MIRIVRKSKEALSARSSASGNWILKSHIEEKAQCWVLIANSYLLEIGTPRAARDYSKKLNIVLLQQMPEGTIRDFQQFSRTNLNAAGLLQGRFNQRALNASNVLFKVNPIL